MKNRGYQLVDINRLSLLTWLRINFFEKFKTLLNTSTYHGIYQDEGLVVFKGNKIVKEIQNC